MSSKIVRASEEKRAEPIVWPVAGCDSEVSQPGGGVHPTSDRQRRQMEVRLGEAHQTGYREGEAAGRRQVEPVIERLARSVEALTTLRPRLRREAEADLLKLAVVIARRILHRELAVDPDAVRGLIRAALDRLQAQEVCRVRVHPDHEAVLRTFLEHLGPARQIEVTADRTLEPGGVVFETTRGNLDSSVETQLQEIERGLADRLRRKP